jgi:hypothetical protein
MGKGSFVVVIKQKHKTIIMPERYCAFNISGNRQAATKCLLLQLGHPAQASVNKD